MSTTCDYGFCDKDVDDSPGDRVTHDKVDGVWCCPTCMHETVQGIEAQNEDARRSGIPAARDYKGGRY